MSDLPVSIQLGSAVSGQPVKQDPIYDQAALMTQYMQPQFAGDASKLFNAEQSTTKEKERIAGSWNQSLAAR